MNLKDYPRPKNDNGRGVHWFPTLGQRRAVVDENVPRLVDLKLRWLVFWNGLDDPALLVNDYLIKRLVAAGICPVMHIYLRPIAPLDDAALTRLHRLVSFYRDPVRRVDYFQLFYEPNVAGEWPGEQMPEDPVAAFLDAWLPAAQEVIGAGGLPGFAPMWPGGDYDDLRFLAESLDAIKERGQGLILEKAWIALHNYNLGHPMQDPADTGGFYRYAAVSEVVAEHVERVLPLLTTEGGTRAGDPPYGDGADEQQVRADTLAAFEHMKSAPEQYFCYCPWLFGNLLGGGDDPAWEPMAWFRGDGSQQAVVQAVAGLDDYVRQPSAVPEVGGAAVKEKYFEETRHWVRGAFLEFFTRYGLDLCGYPLGDAILENGLPTQYFQKVVMEEYWPGRIRLRAVGEEVADLHGQVEQLQGQLEALEKQAAEPQARAEQPGAEAVAGDVTSEALAARLAAAEAELQRLREERAALSAQLAGTPAAGASSELASVAAAEIYRLQGRVADLEKSLDAARAEAGQATAARDQVAAQLQDLQGRIASGEVMAVASREALEVAQLVKEQETKLAEDESRIAQLEKEKAQLARHLKSLEKQVAGLEAQVASAESQARVTEPGPNLKELQDRLAALEAQLVGAQEQVKRLEADKAQLSGQVAELQATLAQVQSASPGPTVHELQDRIAQLEAALADSQAAVQAMMADKPIISQVMDKWKAAQQALGGGRDAARLQELQARVAELERALAAAQSELKEVGSSRQPAAADGAALRMQELQDRVTQLDAYIGTAQEEMRRLREENKQLAGHIAELEAARPPA